MRHQAEHVAFGVPDARNIVERAVRIGFRRGFPLRGAVTKDNLRVGLQSGERHRVGVVVAVCMGNGNLQDLPGLAEAGKRCGGVLDLDMNVLADKRQRLIPKHGAGEQPRFEQDLEAVADAEDHATLRRECLDRPHHRRKSGDGAGAKIIAIGEPAGQDDRIEAGQRSFLMPDWDRFLAEDAGNDVDAVVIAVGAGENDDAEIH